MTKASEVRFTLQPVAELRKPDLFKPDPDVAADTS